MKIDPKRLEEMRHESVTTGYLKDRHARDLLTAYAELEERHRVAVWLLRGQCAKHKRWKTYPLRVVPCGCEACTFLATEPESEG